MVFTMPISRFSFSRAALFFHNFADACHLKFHIQRALTMARETRRVREKIALMIAPASGNAGTSQR
jgi:hypothetical protein